MTVKFVCPFALSVTLCIELYLVQFSYYFSVSCFELHISLSFSHLVQFDDVFILLETGRGHLRVGATSRHSIPRRLPFLQRPNEFVAEIIDIDFDFDHLLHHLQLRYASSATAIC